jgi:hypothetical protein
MGHPGPSLRATGAADAGGGCGRGLPELLDHQVLPGQIREDAQLNP